ncbi:hypothetical protein ROE7235_01739 [Roseibaca ekhonensis]|uniref:Type VI secretion system-associated protein TagF n=1 Tax=Roseinatronobacter ekhonensis TaxID=254356 RepID=A0A3B0MEB3_9RHOB|nr:type VI secretion system-associated protein TagF [Roseibaca ekhonensis]SUZ31988.1 hypothetical protein ROE7235_01739 [Roseibaca ekhonensis]
MGDEKNTDPRAENAAPTEDTATDDTAAGATPLADAQSAPDDAEAPEQGTPPGTQEDVGNAGSEATSNAHAEESDDDPAAPDPDLLAQDTAETDAEQADPPDAVVDPPIEATLPPRASAQVGLFGKLPMRGDFITRQMPNTLSRPFEDWLIPLVQDTRATLGADWSRIWHSAGAWNFWLGADVFQGNWHKDMHGRSGSAGASVGVLQPSADKHGRDFPIVLLLADGQSRLVPPPVVTPPDAEWYAMCRQFLHSARAGQDIAELETALANLPAPRLPAGAEEMAPLLESRALWAEGSGDVWNDIARADHQLAGGSRSYWWQDGGSVLSLVGLPDADTFAFMLSQGQPTLPDPTPDDHGPAFQ